MPMKGDRQGRFREQTVHSFLFRILTIYLLCKPFANRLGWSQPGRYGQIQTHSDLHLPHLNYILTLSHKLPSLWLAVPAPASTFGLFCLPGARILPKPYPPLVHLSSQQIFTEAPRLWDDAGRGHEHRWAPSWSPHQTCSYLGAFSSIKASLIV